MISLPAALGPWAHLLGIFPEDLALSLAPWVQRIAAAVGPYGLSVPAAGDAIDGYDGVTRKGDYDRLLISEWALAEALPEEFQRRAAMYELTFLQRAFQGPRAVKQCVALFDAGPEQLGAPRIAQLATLIVLAARAEASGAAFRWGVIQEGSGQLHSEVTRETTMAFLGARTWASAALSLDSRWMAEPDPSEDLWVVGGPSLHAALARTAALSRVTIEEPLEIEKRELKLEVARKAHRSRLTLELPPEDVCIRLLRNPFETSAPAASATLHLPRCASNLVISGDGRHLLYLTGRGALVAQQIPNSPRASPTPPIVWSPPTGHTVIAAGRASFSKRRRRGMSLDVVTLHAGGLRVATLGRRGGVRDLLQFERQEGSPTPIARPERLGLGELVGRGGLERVLVFDGHSRIAELHVNRTYDLRALEAEFFVTCSGRAIAARASFGALEAFMSEDAAWVPLRIEALPGAALFVGYAPERSEGPGLWAHGPPDGRITLYEGQRSRILQAPSGTAVVGVARMERGAGLLLLEKNRRAISWMGVSGTKELLVTATPIERTVTSAATPVMAVTTTGGELAILDVFRGRVLFRALMDAEEEAP